MEHKELVAIPLDAEAGRYKVLVDGLLGDEDRRDRASLTKLKVSAVALLRTLVEDIGDMPRCELLIDHFSAYSVSQDAMARNQVVKVFDYLNQRPEMFFSSPDEHEDKLERFGLGGKK